MSFLKTLNPQDGIINQSDLEQYQAVESFGADPMHLENNKIPLDLNWQKKEEFKKEKIDVQKNDLLRVDGTKKSEEGYLGPIINNTNNQTMTEVSVQFDDVLGGSPIPILVPGQSEEDLEWLRNNPIEGNASNFPETLKAVAIRHAMERNKAGLDPFFSEQDKPFVNSRGGEILHNYESEDGIFLWQESAYRLYGDPNLFSDMYKPMDFNYNASPEEISEWALEFTARIANNLVYGGLALTKFNELRNESKLDIYRLLKMYEDSEATGVANLWYEDENQKFDGVAWDGIYRALRGIGTDPSTWTGGIIYKGGANLLAKLSGKVGKGTLASTIMKAMLSPTMLVSVEGGVYSSAFDYQMQQYQIEGQATNPETFGGMPPPEDNPFPTELNKTSLASSYALGAILGPAFEQAIPLSVKSFKNVVEKIRKENNIPETEPIKDMVILHNTGGEAILQYDELGGIPAPSLAVTKSDQVFEGFGDIQLIAKPRNFDPAEDPKNVIYGSDAYTPRMPEGKNKYLDNADELMEADYLPLFEKYDITDGGPRVDLQNNLKDFKRPSYLARIKFLDELGYEKEIREALDVDVEKIRKESIEKLEKVIANPTTNPYQLKQLNNFLTIRRREYLDKNIRKEDNITNLFNAVADFKELDVNDFLRQERLKYSDPNKTFTTKNKKVQRRIDRLTELINDPAVQRDNDLYEKYVLEMEELEFGGSKFEDLPFTLDNILENMLEEVQRGGEVGFGSGGPNKVRAVASKSYRSLDEVKADKDRILSPDEQLSKENAKAGKIVNEDGSFQGDDVDLEYQWGKMHTMIDRVSEGGVDSDQLYYSMIDAIRSDGSEEGIRRAFEYNGGAYFNPDVIQRINNFIEILRESEVPYFEGKPQRVVQLNEFGGAIVHKNTDPKVIEILEKNGLEIIMEPPNMSGEKSYDASGYQDQTRQQLKKFFFTVPPAIVVGSEIIDENNRQEK